MQFFSIKVIFALFAADGLRVLAGHKAPAGRRPVTGRIDWLRYERFAPRLRIRPNCGIRVQVKKAGIQIDKDVSRLILWARDGGHPCLHGGKLPTNAEDDRMQLDFRRLRPFD